MRLVIMARYLSGKRLNSTLLHTAIFSFFFITSINGQTFRLSFRQIPLSQALIQVSKQLDIKIAFDSEKLSSVTINKEVTGNSVDEFMKNLLFNSGFEFKFLYDRYLIVEKDSEKNNKPPGKCQIVGSVSDKENGEHLPYASIILYNHNLLTSASENGSFCVKDVSSNPVHLMVSYIGYLPVDTTIEWNDPSLNIDIKLCRRIKMLDTIFVNGNNLEMVDLRNDVDFATTIDPGRLIDLPVLAETDIFRMLQLLPGVSYTENSSGLNIRGGMSDQNLVLFDGQTLYNLSHFYGVISALNPNIIKDLQIYKGGYDSRFGERVSGIIDITGKSGTQFKPTVYGDINLLDANITAELPVTRKLTMIAAVRRSYSDIYSTEFSNDLFTRNISSLRGDSTTIVTQTKPSYSFYDYNAKLTYRIGNLENISISVYGGKDYFLNSYGQDSRRFNINSTDRNTWNNYGISATWVKQWKKPLYSNLQIGTSGYSNDFSNSTTIDHPSTINDNHRFLPDTVNIFNTYNQNQLADIYISLRNNYKVSERNELNFGVLARNNNIFYHKDADRIYIYDNTRQSALTSTIYLQDRILLSDKLIIKPGFRISYYSGQNKSFLEPRFSVNYKFSESLSVRMAAGRYFQFISQVLAQQETGYNKNFWVLADDSLHPAISSDHFIAGFTAEKGRFLFDAEAYYKTFTGLQEYIFLSQYLKNSDFPNYFPKKGEKNNSYSSPSYYVTGAGQSYGIDLLMRYKSRIYTSWISFSLGRSLQHFKQINNNQEIPSTADQPYQMSWTNMLSLGKWNLGTITLMSSGKPYIDFAHSSAYPEIVRNYKRLPDYFRSDVSVNYNFSILKMKFKTGVTLYNIFNTQNYFDINNRKFDFENNSFSETTLIRSQSLSVNLFVHFIF
jgi:ferric enterobactin receptor